MTSYNFIYNPIPTSLQVFDKSIFSVSNSKSGNQGIQGLGTQGRQGYQGYQGLQGYQGYQGFQGLQGLQGFQGRQGYQGLQGYQGFQGFQGLQGFQGFQGYQGYQGRQGYQGFQGIQGIQGNLGIQGIQGPSTVASAPVNITTTSTANDPTSNGFYVNNSVTGNTSAHAIVACRTVNSTSGSPYVSLDVNGVNGWSIVVDNQDSQAFKINNAWNYTTSSTFNAMKIDTSRNVYFYQQVSMRQRFFATMAYAGSYTSGNIQFTGSLQDLSGTASISSGILQLPSTYAGYYTIEFSGRVSDGSATQGISMYAGAVNLFGSSDGVYWIGSDGTRRCFSFSRTIYLSSSTQIRAEFYASTTVDIVRCCVTYHGVQS